MVFKKKENEKKFSKSYFFLVVESAPVDGFGLVSCGVFLVVGACACVLIGGVALISLKGSSVQ